MFSDLRAMATTEARVVLGAAVADDVMGLVVLTVVVRLVTEGSVSLVSVAGIVLGAVAFLVVGVFVGMRVAPPLFRLVEQVSRSTGTLVALALAFTLAFAELADAARLAPIVGAFVAGIALNRSDQSDRIRRELTPVGHLFIPVFFLQIGIDADITSFGQASVLRDAAILLAVAVVGKLVSPLGAIGTPGDKTLIGLGMLPRGEVGLIFATIGLANGVLNDDLYAALLLVVLVTTLATPQLLKHRYGRLRARARPTGPPPGTPAPPGGWLDVVDDEVRLRATPPLDQALPVALAAAVAVGRNRPGEDLLDWLAGLPADEPAWNATARERLLDVVERGNARGWRFLDTTGVLDRALPELAGALRRRHEEPFTIDPLQAYRFVAMERLRRLDADDPVALEIRALDGVDRLFFAVLLSEAPDGAAALADRIGLAGEDAAVVLDTVRDRDLLWSAARQPGALGEEKVLQVASHLGTPERARLLYTVSALRAEGRERWELVRLRDLHELIQAALDHPELTGPDARGLADLRRLEAVARVADDPALIERVGRAPLAYVLRQPSEAIARHARLVHPRPGRAEARVRTGPAGDGRWWIDVAARDRPALLATVTGVLARAGLDVRDAVVATWDDSAALETFTVRAAGEPDATALGAAVAAGLGSRTALAAAARRRGRLRPPGLALAQRVRGALAGPARPAPRRGRRLRRRRGRRAGRRRSAPRTPWSSTASRWSTGNGAKLGPAHEQAVRRFLREGVTPRRRFGRRQGARRSASQASASG